MAAAAEVTMGSSYNTFIMLFVHECSCLLPLLNSRLKRGQHLCKEGTACVCVCVCGWGGVYVWVCGYFDGGYSAEYSTSLFLLELP